VSPKHRSCNVDQASSLRKIVDNRALKRNKKISSKNFDESSLKVLAVTSGKGGVGKTNVVGNLSIALSEFGKNVLIIDADMGLGNVDIIFGIRPEYNIGHVIRGEKKLKDVIVKTSHGISIIPGGSGFSDLTNLTEGEKLNLLCEFETLDYGNVDESSDKNGIDFVFIDTGAGIASNVAYFNMAAEECMVVATFEPTSITDAYALMKVMATQYGTKYFKLLVNMVQNAKEAKSVYLSLSQAVDRFLSGVVVEYVGFIPTDVKLRNAVIKRIPVMDFAPDAASSLAFREVGSKLARSNKRNSSSGNISFFFKKCMNADIL